MTCPNAVNEHTASAKDVTVNKIFFILIVINGVTILLQIYKLLLKNDKNFKKSQ